MKWTKKTSIPLIISTECSQLVDSFLFILSSEPTPAEIENQIARVGMATNRIEQLVLFLFLFAFDFQNMILFAQVGNAVRTQSKDALQGKKDLDAAKESMQVQLPFNYVNFIVFFSKELFTKIGDIKRKAAASESMVTEICGDIKLLDYGKRHLTFAINSLKKLQLMGIVYISSSLCSLLNSKHCSTT
jgi:hypothetical protein